MNYQFELSDELKAERLGRAIIEKHVPCPGEKWLSLVDCSVAGAGALAAIRHARNLGAECGAVMTTPQADGNSSFASMLEVVGCMDMPVSLLGSKGITAKDATIIIGCESSLSAPVEAKLEINVNDFSPDDAWEVCPAGSNPETLLHSLEGDTPLYSCDEIREIDRLAIEEFGLPGICLMENAGIGACAIAREMLNKTKSQKIAVFAGAGNNGGDAYVVARGLLETGYEIDLYLLTAPERLRGDAASNFDILDRAGVPWELPQERSEIEINLCAKEKPVLIIDGILGTGLKGAPRGIFGDCIKAINDSGVPVLALDIPSGLDGDTGEALGSTAIKADTTITFAAVKQGFATDNGQYHTGNLYLADIGAPKEILD